MTSRVLGSHARDIFFLGFDWTAFGGGFVIVHTKLGSRVDHSLESRHHLLIAKKDGRIGGT